MARVAQRLGQEVRDERLRRGWRLIDLAERAEISMPTAHGVEAGEISSLDGYVRLALALGLTPRIFAGSDMRCASMSRTSTTSSPAAPTS